MKTSAISIYVINLDHRSDRWNQFQEAWKDILDFEKVKRISAIPGTTLHGFMQRPWFTDRTAGKEKTWAGVAGCILSHKKALETALKNRDDRIIIFEDDAIPSPSLGKDTLRALFDKLIQEPDPSWDACYCGYTRLHANIPQATASTSPCRHPIKGALAASTYILTRRSILAILPHLPAERDVWAWVARFRAIDTWYYYHLHSVLSTPLQVITPPAALQSASFSDIGQKETYYFSSSDLMSSITLKPLFPFWINPLLRISRTLTEWFKFFRSRLLGLPGSKNNTSEPGTPHHHHS